MGTFPCPAGLVRCPMPSAPGTHPSYFQQPLSPLATLARCFTLLQPQEPNSPTSQHALTPSWQETPEDSGSALRSEERGPGVGPRVRGTCPPSPVMRQPRRRLSGVGGCRRAPTSHTPLQLASIKMDSNHAGLSVFLAPLQGEGGDGWGNICSNGGWVKGTAQK